MVSYGCLLGAERTPSFIACFPLQLAKQHCAIISPSLPLRSAPFFARARKNAAGVIITPACARKRGERETRV